MAGGTSVWAGLSFQISHPLCTMEGSQGSKWGIHAQGSQAEGQILSSLPLPGAKQVTINLGGSRGQVCKARVTPIPSQTTHASSFPRRYDRCSSSGLFLAARPCSTEHPGRRRPGSLDAAEMQVNFIKIWHLAHSVLPTPFHVQTWHRIRSIGRGALGLTQQCHFPPHANPSLRSPRRR